MPEAQWPPEAPPPLQLRWRPGSASPLFRKLEARQDPGCREAEESSRPSELEASDWRCGCSGAVPSDPRRTQASGRGERVTRRRVPPHQRPGTTLRFVPAPSAPDLQAPGGRRGPFCTTFRNHQNCNFDFPE
ncbi:hypothetical protein H1C71_040544 [Ictidomys tridecemlineatus]|nr:hypothetical protein H1C71_040544 [Ictidomys tridecemlineatus]